jgi:hypothetical protein
MHAAYTSAFSKRLENTIAFAAILLFLDFFMGTDQ